MQSLWGTTGIKTDVNWCDDNLSGQFLIEYFQYSANWLYYLFSPHDVLLRNGVLNPPRELTWPALWSRLCKEHRMFLFARFGQSKELTTGPALLPCLPSLWAEECVSGRVGCVHRCPISSSTAVNLTTVAVQRCSHEISRPVRLKARAQRARARTTVYTVRLQIKSAINDVSNCNLWKSRGQKSKACAGFPSDG